MMIRFLCAALLALVVPAVAPTLAHAQDGPAFQHFRAGSSTTLAPDKAYFLIRMPEESVSTKLQPVFLRKPSAAELAAYRAAKAAAYAKAGKDAGPIESFDFQYTAATNLFQIENGKFLAKEGNDRLFLIATDPGDYVFYGAGFNKFLWQCNCMGTVSFTAKPGEITDLGAFLITLAWKKSGFPELAEDTDLGPKMRQDYAMFAIGVRPGTGKTGLAQLAGLPLRAAEYHAVGAFREPARLLANRLAPLPGVLGYDKGAVIDRRTGAVVPKRF
jgi:hypothetical protein